MSAHLEVWYDMSKGTFKYMSKGGRPTKYDPSFVEKVDEYLAECQDRTFRFHRTQGEKSDTYERRIKVKLPTIEGLALYLDVSKQTLYTWGEKHPEFLDALGKIEREQKQRLIEKGLSGDYNPLIAKLVLSANHGMKERKDVTTDDEPVNFTELIKQTLGAGKAGTNTNTKRS